jgi:hypothetical protein
MSDFILVVPAGWTRFDVPATGMSADTIITASMQTITEMLRIAGLITETDIVQEARIFDNEIFIVRLA